ncbi:MAG: SDR family oxidoreductase [Bacteroidota bacterium]
MKTMFDLSGKTAVVTGGCSGIGEAIVTQLYGQGASVHVLDIDIANRDFQECEDISLRRVDVTSSDQVRQAIEKMPEQIDILVNNAGIAHIGSIETTSEEELDRLYEVNVKGLFHVTKATLPKMKKEGGSIINMASIASLVGLNDRFAYNMSKGAVYSMTFSIAKDYLSCGIRCNCIAPARIHTPFVDGFIKQNYPGKEAEMFEQLAQSQPIGRMGTPDEVAAMVVYLASNEASFITGSCFSIDGGFLKLNG